MALTSSGVGTCGPDDNQAQAGHLVTFQKTTRPATSDHPDVWEQRDVAATLSPFDLGSETRAVELVVQPLALRGREDGAQLEIGPEGGPYNALRAGDGGSSRQSLVAITATGETTHTLTAEGHDASEDGTGRGTPVIAFSHTAGIDQQASERITPTMKAGHDTMPSIATDTTVRRLTPMECERLQGFPDGHTLTSNGKPQADSARYRQMGNAVAVPCVEWIVRRIVDAHDGGAA